LISIWRWPLGANLGQRKGGYFPGSLRAAADERKDADRSPFQSQVSRLCGEIDAWVKTFLNRPLESGWPCIWLDATYVKVPRAGRIVSVPVIIALGVNSDGRREILGMAIGASEAETFWTQFLRTLARRGLHGVKLVISDAHEGVNAAAAKVLLGDLATLSGSHHAQPAGSRRAIAPRIRCKLIQAGNVKYDSSRKVAGSMHYSSTTARSRYHLCPIYQCVIATSN
jgi:hypothetical protein